MSREPVMKGWSLLFIIAFLCLAALPAGAQRLSMWIDDQMLDCDVHHETPYIPFDVYLFDALRRRGARGRARDATAAVCATCPTAAVG